MSTRTRISGALAVAAILLLLVSVAVASSPPAKRPMHAGTSVVHGGTISNAKAVGDTIVLMGPWGSGAFENGQFQTPQGTPAWNGWTSRDLTQSETSYWHADTFQPLAGDWSAWCGDAGFPSCGVDDEDGGYGNSWDEILEWRGTVADPTAPCTVDVSAQVQVRTEPGYDYCYVTVVKSTASVDIWTRDGINPSESISLQTNYMPGSYVGENEDEVAIQFRVTSDAGWSDADCSFSSDGAFLLDDLAISLDNGTGYSHDFEDGTLGELVTVYPQGVGDFAKIWTGLETSGDCNEPNRSPLVAFIDDGVVVPGTGGTLCIDHCYGPGGYIVNTSGGLAGPDEHIHNVVESPVMPWPGPDYDGSQLEFDVWRDMTLGVDDPGIFFIWSVRWTNDPDPATIENGIWTDRNFVYYGGPDWLRMVQPLGDLIPSQAQWVQVQLGIVEMGYAWGWTGSNGTPAPYFDNVRLTAFYVEGPSLTAVVNDLPHDTFPEGGQLDLVNPGNNNIRFDSGTDISAPSDLRNDPGDSVTLSIEPLREGATLVGMPRLHWNLKRNPAFDPYRTSGLPDRGSMDGWQVLDSNGVPLPVRFAFDLPDTGFLFPGDFLYYYFEATDDLGGVQYTSTLPADTTGFSNFDDPMAYPPIYKLHALPTMTESSPGVFEQPRILFWDDAGAEGNRDEWYMSFRNLGLIAGLDYDIYYTNNPRLGSGQGLGGRSTAEQLAGYDDLLYTCGKVSLYTLGDGSDFNGDRSRDVQVLSGWLEQGGKDLFLTGDDLAGDLARGTPLHTAFLQDWIGVDLLEEDVLPMIDQQTDAVVMTEFANPVFLGLDQWRAIARCSAVSSQYYSTITTSGGLKRYDGVVSRSTAQRLAEFTDPAGAPGAYAYNAATLNLRPDFNARVISLPYDFEGVWTVADGANAPSVLASRTLMLGEILDYFGAPTGFDPTPVPEASVFAADLYPNPFNPVTNIQWNLPRAGHLSVQVYDVRGRLVRSLVDEPVAAGAGQVQWDGRGSDGRIEAAGTYFYRVRSGDHLHTGKMSLIK